jgi:outer membrane immunogenic protein
MCASGAYAADMPLKAAAAAPAPTWTGWYVGINGGGALGRDNPSVLDVGPDTFLNPANFFSVVSGGSEPVHMSGGLAGGQVGFLYRTGQTILGLEAGFDWTNVQGARSFGPTAYPVAVPPATFRWNNQGRQEGLFTVLGRVGFNAGNWYPYVTGGVAVTQLQYRSTYTDSFYPSVLTSSFTKEVGGGAVGVGVEVRLADHWMLRGEYLYMQFNGFGGNGTIACTPGVGNCAGGVGNKTTFSFDTRFNENIARAALSYKF